MDIFSDDGNVIVFPNPSLNYLRRNAPTADQQPNPSEFAVLSHHSQKLLMSSNIMSSDTALNQPIAAPPDLHNDFEVQLIGSHFQTFKELAPNLYDIREHATKKRRYTPIKSNS